MRDRDPKTHGELKEKYGKILGRKPTEEEVDRLMGDVDELGMRYDDPVLLQVMLFQRERERLEGVFERHVREINKQLKEAREGVLREADKALTRRMGEIVIVGSQAVERTLQEQKQKVEEEHRKMLAAVKESTETAVKKKWEETMGLEWGKMMGRFSTDWNEKVVPALGKLEGSVHHERRVGLMWFAMATLLAGAMGFAFGSKVWPVREREPAPVGRIEAAPVNQNPNPQPVPGASSKSAPGSGAQRK